LSERRAGWPESLAAYVGYERLEDRDGVIRARMEVRPEHVAPNGFLQASVVIALADMCCASGTMATIPELKTNLLSTAREGAVVCEATLQHGGRTTHVWDAVVTSQATGRRLALFRCTQLILRPPAG
jgi:uncharacterized protein (TIGR00369 family)